MTTTPSPKKRTVATSTVEPRTTPDGIVCRAVRIAGTDEFRFSAWERTAGYTAGQHSTFTHVDGVDGLLGRVGTVAPGAWLDELAPGSQERVAAAREHYAADKARAIDAILTAFPGLRRVGREDRGGGEVTCTADQLDAALDVRL